MTTSRGDLMTASGPFETRRDARVMVAHILDSEPGDGSWRDGNLRLLEDACRAVGAPLGAYDHQALLVVAEGEPVVCAVLAKLIAFTPGPSAREDLMGPPGVAQDGGMMNSGPMNWPPS